MHQKKSEPISLSTKNRLWFRIQNLGNNHYVGPVRVVAHFAHKYARSLGSYEPTNWAPITTSDFDSLSFAASADTTHNYITLNIMWVPKLVMRENDLTRARDSGKLYIMLSVEAPIDELRYHNNTAFVMLPVVP